MTSRGESAGRFKLRYRPGMGGSGHQLSVKSTKEMIRELLAAEGITHSKQQLICDILFTEALDPPDEIRAEMVSAVAGKFDATHIEQWRIMLRRYVELQYGVKLDHARYDK